ncbi:MAG: family 20 glycosylhydrolase [Verrucomicrobia bacterium]|nr:family 20 glycosylhydrolase [Verrucomicrobiota bacterium]
MTKSHPPIRAFQWDLARQVERLDVLLDLLPRYADWGYQELYLHLEDAVEYPSLPSVARADAYTTKQFTELVATATRVGIKVVPIVNLLGHTQYLIKDPALRDLNELRAPDGSPLERGQICPLHPRTLEIAEKLLRDMAPFCTGGKIHVGLDESFNIGKCPRCRDEIARIGLAGHFAGHVGRLHGIARYLGLRMGIWADMLNFIPEAIPLLPASVIAYDWYYYPFKRHPRVELFNFAESDLATPLRGRGIEYWGCPMNGAFRYEPLPIYKDRLANIRSWWQRCVKTGAGGFLTTSWEAYRLALETTTVVDATAASLWLEGAPENDLDWLAKGCARVFGKSGSRSAAKAALACDEYPFSGYARWEINDRWNAGAATSPKEEKHFARLAAKPLPAALAASIAFRHYLAQRDGFVARGKEGVKALRKSIAQRRVKDNAPYLGVLETEAKEFSQAIIVGRKAARTMWRLTRDPKVHGQNEAILDADVARLREWRAWLRAVRLDPQVIFTASPVLGRWQLDFTVQNFAPALQKVVVEQQQADGSWRALQSRHTIEFQAEAAKPRTNIRRPFSVPVESDTAVLRISVHGLGQVAIEDVVLSNGVTSRRAQGLKKRSALGRPAPRAGFPDIAAAQASNRFYL